MDLAGQALPLLDDARLPGLGHQPGVQFGVFGHRGFQSAVRLGQFADHLSPLLILLQRPVGNAGRVADQRRQHARHHQVGNRLPRVPRRIATGQHRPEFG